MIAVLLAAALALGEVQQQTDTTLAVRPGGTLDVQAFGARASIRSWDRSEVRIQAAHDPGIRIRVRQRGNTIRAEAERRDGVPATGVRFDIVVPRSFSVQLEGVNFSVDAEALRGDVRIENVEGTLDLRSITGNITVESVTGPLRMQDVAGRIAVSSVNQRVDVTRVRGTVSIETVNGSVVIRGADADTVRVSTLNGFIEYDGAIRDGGHYYLGTHNGRISMSVPEQANARIQVAATTGKVETAFPVALGAASQERFAITVGTGSARVELESFNGTIRLVRPGGR
jgi:DUF4097 and DUF4098 domain-containing protein YvlB